MFKRDLYLNQLTESKGNHLIKVITGIRRSGKTYLLNNIFLYHLKNNNVNDKYII